MLPALNCFSLWWALWRLSSNKHLQINTHYKNRHIAISWQYIDTVGLQKTSHEPQCLIIFDWCFFLLNHQWIPLPSSLTLLLLLHRLPFSPSSALADLHWPRTSADRHLASPAAVRAAHTVLWTPRKEITWLTGVHQGVTVGGQVQTHNVSVGRVPWLLARVSWRASRGQTR